MAYRSGDYKLHLATRERTRDPESGKQEPSVTHEPGLLFDLKKDPSESQNIAAEHPELVQRLTKEFEEAQSALKEWTPF